MASVPPGKAGSASAVQNTVRQVSTAMGVAVLGAVISFHYRPAIEPTLTRVTEETHRHPDPSVGESIESTVAFAKTLGASGDALRSQATGALATAGTVASALAALAFVLLVAAIWIDDSDWLWQTWGVVAVTALPIAALATPGPCT